MTSLTFWAFRPTKAPTDKPAKICPAPACPRLHSFLPVSNSTLASSVIAAVCLSTVAWTSASDSALGERFDDLSAHADQLVQLSLLLVQLRLLRKVQRALILQLVFLVLQLRQRVVQFVCCVPNATRRRRVFFLLLGQLRLRLFQFLFLVLQQSLVRFQLALREQNLRLLDGKLLLPGLEFPARSGRVRPAARRSPLP